MADSKELSVHDAQRVLASFDWATWKRELADRYSAWYGDVLHAEGEATARALDADWHKDDPYVTRFADRYIADRVTQLDETTRGQLRDTIERLFDTGSADGSAVTPQIVASTLRDTFDEFAGSRANTIGRTEVAIVENQGAALGYSAGGFNYVEISDGDGDEECAAADGQIWSIAYWLANPIEHPNCERSGAPISDDDAAAQGIDRE